MQLPLQALTQVAARNLLRQLRHSLFALSAVCLGVAGLALADGFLNDLFHQLAESSIRTELGHVQIARAGYFAEGAGRPEAFVIEAPESLRSAVSANPQVRTVAARLQLSGVATAGRRQFPVQIVGLEPETEEKAGGYLTLLEGKGFSRPATAFEAMLGEGLARRLGLRAGDPFLLGTATADGALNAEEFSAVGVFRTFSKDYDDRVVRIRLDDAQQLAQIDGVHSLVLGLGDTDSTDPVIANLHTLPQMQGLEAQPWYRLSDFYANARALYARQFGVLQGIALCLMAMSVLTSANIMVFARTSEFGTMRALGASSRTVIWMVVMEAAVLGLLGAALGVLLAIGLAMLVSAIGIPMPPPPNAEAGFVARILLTPSTLAGAAGVGWLATVLGALVPAMRTRRVTIVTALGHRL